MDYNPYHKKKFSKHDYIRAFIWGLIFSTVAFVFQIYRTPNRDLFIKLSNSFLLGGVLQLVYAAFSYINKEGFFDVGIVGFKQLGSTIESGLRGSKDLRDLPDLQSYKVEKMRTRRVNLPTLISGIFYLVLAIVAAVIFSYK